MFSMKYAPCSGFALAALAIIWLPHTALAENDGSAALREARIEAAVLRKEADFLADQNQDRGHALARAEERVQQLSQAGETRSRARYIAARPAPPAEALSARSQYMAAQNAHRSMQVKLYNAQSALNQSSAALETLVPQYENLRERIHALAPEISEARLNHQQVVTEFAKRVAGPQYTEYLQQAERRRGRNTVSDPNLTRSFSDALGDGMERDPAVLESRQRLESKQEEMRNLEREFRELSTAIRRHRSSVTARGREIPFYQARLTDLETRYNEARAAYEPFRQYFIEEDAQKTRQPRRM